MTSLIFIGGGRLAGLLYAAFHERYDILGYVDDVHAVAYLTQTYGVKCLGTSAVLADWVGTGAKAVVAITDPRARRKYGELAESLGLALETLVFPTAVVDPFAEVGAGCILRHQAVVGPQVRLGKNCVVSDLAYVGHDSVVGDHCYLSPGSKLNGSVTVGDTAFVGTNAVVLPEHRVGARCTIAASACVTVDVPDDGRVVGVPARPLPAKPHRVEAASPGPRLSVLMSAYNHEAWVEEAIQSVLDQSFRDFEFLIVDDGSTDGTVEVIRRFEDPRIRFTPLGQNHGISEAKQRLMAQARGTYIAVQNSDDAYLPGKLEAQVQYLDTHPDTAVVFTRTDVVDDAGYRLPNHCLTSIFRHPNRTREAWLNHFFHKGNALCASTALARRDVLVSLGYLDRRLKQLQDLDLWVRVCLGHGIHILDETFTRFRIHANQSNASAPRPEVLVRAIWETTRILRNYLRIPDEATLLRIFPELAGSLDPDSPLEADLIPFALALLSQRHAEPHHQWFALETLHDLLEDPDRNRRIKARFRFDHRHLIDLTGRLDIFHTLGKGR